MFYLCLCLPSTLNASALFVDPPSIRSTCPLHFKPLLTGFLLNLPFTPTPCIYNITLQQPLVIFIYLLILFIVRHDTYLELPCTVSFLRLLSMFNPHAHWGFQQRTPQTPVSVYCATFMRFSIKRNVVYEHGYI